MPRKKSFAVVILLLLAFSPVLSLAALYEVRGTGTEAIDTLTLSDNFLSRPNGPQASEMVIFHTVNGSTPNQTRDSIVAAAAGLSNFVVTAAGPGLFSVETYPSPGGAVDVLLNGQLITMDPDGVTAHSGQNFIQRPSQIPTLSEWGVILFATLLLASLVWFIRRKRKLARARA